MHFSQIMSLSLLNNGCMDLFLGKLSAQLETKSEPAFKSGRTMLAEALTGRLRGDTAVMRQGARNAEEGAALAETASAAATSLSETLSEMLALHNSGSTDATALKNLAAKAATILENARYNGISLFDGSKWASDSRLTISSDGQKAYLSLQFGYRESEFALANLDTIREYADRQLADVDWDALEADVKTTALLAQNYARLAESYGIESEHMSNLANLYAASEENALDFDLAGQTSGKGNIFSASS